MLTFLAIQTRTWFLRADWLGCARVLLGRLFLCSKHFIMFFPAKVHVLKNAPSDSNLVAHIMSQLPHLTALDVSSLPASDLEILEPHISSLAPNLRELSLLDKNLLSPLASGFPVFPKLEKLVAMPPIWDGISFHRFPLLQSLEITRPHYGFAILKPSVVIDAVVQQCPLLKSLSYYDNSTVDFS